MTTRPVLTAGGAAGEHLPIVGAAVRAIVKAKLAGGDPACGEGPASAAGASASYLVIKGSNTTSGASQPEPNGKWTKQQFKIRRLFSDRLSYWQSHGYECHWVTLSSPALPCARTIREDFLELRRRIGRCYGYEGVEYCCVETSEGNGVLHLVWAIPTGKARAFFVSYTWLSAEWMKIRGAWNVSISRVKNSGGDRRRLTRYVVCQYAGGQSAFVRASQSRLGVPLTKMRKALLGAMRGSYNRFEMFAACGMKGAEVGSLMGEWFFQTLRRAWGELVETGECRFFKRRFVWFCGELGEV